jgi:hypothetical protein
MLRELMCLWLCVWDQGRKKARIHEQLHVPDDIEGNGASQGSHTGPTEHNHIRLVKQPAKGMQQRAKVLDRQLGQRVSDLYIDNMAHQPMSTKYGTISKETLSSLEQSTKLSSQGAKGWLFVDIHNHKKTFTHPATPCFDLLYTKKELFSSNMVQLLVHHYACMHAWIHKSFLWSW